MMVIVVSDDKQYNYNRETNNYDDNNGDTSNNDMQNEGVIMTV